MHKWFVYETNDAASQAAAEHLANLIMVVLMNKNICHVALPGGGTPRQCLTYLAEKNIQWEKCHWYLGDERCYDKKHPERNDVMLDEYFWKPVGKTNIHTIPAEKGAEQGASIYRSLINVIGKIDIAFLGLGEDGHTASLFPGNAALEDKRSVVPVFNSPKAPSERVSLGIETLRAADHRVILAFGDGKADILTKIKQGDNLPVNMINHVDWFVDKAAFKNIEAAEN